VAVKDDSNLSGKYATRALALLRKAEGVGYFKDPARVEGLKKDNDFAPLRGWAAFQQFLAELEKSGQAETK
jgi:hypothetical protein